MKDSAISPLEFEKFIAPYSLKETVAIAVSGGADSMALMLLMNEWAQTHGTKVVGLTVDHHLRSESTSEASQVHDWLSGRKIEHYTLVWQHGIVTSALQKKAREARYQLLKDWCRAHEVNTLMTAHHLEDQFETFMMRLRKGSGLKGLCCIRSCLEEDDLKLIRPLLPVSRERLKKTLERFSQESLQDPSNKNTQFERIRWRQLLPVLREHELTPENVALTIERFQMADEYIQQQVQIALESCIVVESVNFPASFWHLLRESMDPRNKSEDDTVKKMAMIKINLKLFKELHPEIALRMLTKLLLEIGEHPYPLPYQSLKGLYHKIIAPGFMGATGGGCYLKRVKGGWIEIVREEKRTPTLANAKSRDTLNL